jgi:hypothetical protein
VFNRAKPKKPKNICAIGEKQAIPVRFERHGALATPAGLSIVVRNPVIPAAFCEHRAIPEIG